MKYFSRKIAILFISVLFVSNFIVIGLASASSITLIDQENPGPYETTNGALAPFSFGQSFTPSFSSMNAIEFLLGGTGTAVVNIRDEVLGLDGFGGNIIAQSLPLSFDFLGSHFFRFDFPSMVSLNPGHTYVAEISLISGDIGVRHTQGNAYSGGQFLHQDFPLDVFSEADLVFAEGIMTAVPEPESYVMLIAGLGLFLSQRRRKSTEY